MLNAHDFIILAQALSFAYLAYLTGDLFFRIARMEQGGALGRGAYAVAFGYAAFGIVGLLLGITGLFSAFYFYLFSLAILAASSDTLRFHWTILREFIRSPARITQALRNAYREHAFLTILLTIWLLFNLSLVFVPITGRDTLTFHLPAIKDMIKNERITFSPALDDYYPWSPLLGEIIYAGTAAFYRNASAPFVFQVIQWSTMPLLLILAHDFFRGRFRRTLLAASLPLLLLSIFEIQREVMHGGYVDTLLLLFGAAALFPILELWDKTKAWENKNVYFSSVFMGAALGVKYNAFYVLVITVLFLAGAFWARKRSLRDAGKTLLYAFLIVLATAGFWYGKNALWFGNPIYPIAGIDGSQVVGETLIYDRTPANFLLFPYNHFGSLSERDSSTKLIVFGHFAAIAALMAFLALFDRKNIQTISLLLSAFIALYMGMIFFTSHHTRYFLAPLFFLPPLFLLLADQFFSYLSAVFRSPALSRAAWNAARVTACAIFVVLFVGNVRYFYVKFLYKTGFLSEREYVVEIGGQ